MTAAAPVTADPVNRIRGAAQTTVRPAKVCFSFGMGVDSATIIHEWVNHPATRDFDWEDCVAVTAMTGDEYPATERAMNEVILPLFRRVGLRYVQIARAGQRLAAGYEVLDDSTRPLRMHMRGAHWRLSDELHAAATVPQVAHGQRRCSVDCTKSDLIKMDRPSGTGRVWCMSDLRRRLMEGQVDLDRVGAVTAAAGRFPPFVVIDSAGAEVEPVTRYLRDLALSDMSPLTSRSYGFDLLRWFRVLWALEVDWERATGSEVDVLVGWMKTARNPQRRRTRLGAVTPGTVNIRTGKPTLAEGYAPRTINHCLTAVYGFYAYHQHFGRGPAANPVPSSRARRMALAHRSPIVATQRFKRARLRQRVADTTPRAIADAMWDELFAAMSCDRDRSLLVCYVSSGARASELLGVALGDVDWAGARLHVISKGTRLRQAVPISPEAIRYLTRYLDAEGLPGPNEPLWRTRRGESRALSYWAMRRVLQRANEKLGTNWSLHDLRHTASTRMANDPDMTLRDVQAVLRHASIETTGRYVTVRVEDMFDRLQEHYNRPRPQRTFPAGYSEADIKAVFGG